MQYTWDIIYCIDFISFHICNIFYDVCTTKLYATSPSSTTSMSWYHAIKLSQ